MAETPTSAVSVGSRRILLIDYLRGLALVYMIYYHFLYDMAYMVPTKWGRDALAANDGIVVYGTAAFILLAGLSSAFSRSNAGRGGRLLAIGVAFTLVTAFVFPGEAIYFGILQLLGCCMVLYGGFETFWKKLPAPLLLTLCAVLFALTFHITRGYIGIEGIWQWELPEELRANNYLYPFGILRGGFASVDYEPLLPWFFLYLGGTYLGGYVVRYRNRLPQWCYADPIRRLRWMGQHSLLIYILHQPVILAVVYGLQWLIHLIG